MYLFNSKTFTLPTGFNVCQNLAEMLLLSLLFFCSVRLANWSFFVCKTTANSFTRNCTQFCESWVCCLNFCIFGLYISVSEKYARRAAQWTDTFIHHWRLTTSDRFPRTHSSLSVLVTPQLVLSFCVCVCVSHILCDATDKADCESDLISWLHVLHLCSCTKNQFVQRWL